MSRSTQLCVLAGAMTLADLVVLIHCVPIVCQAWGSNRWIMCALFAGMVAWPNSLRDLWRAATRGRGLFNFTASSSAPTTGFAFADLLLGYPTSTTNNPFGPKIYIRKSDFAVYVQDDWKASSRLTLNLGLRWELPTPFVSANNQLSNFNT